MMSLVERVEAKEKIILPLDVKSSEEARRLVKALKDEVGAFKIGLELVNRCGFDVFPLMREAGAKKIFYDAKFMDIPNTVGGAMHGAVKMNFPWMINVHCSGGIERMNAAKEAAIRAADELDSSTKPPLVMGVTVLTSLDREDLLRIFGYGFVMISV